MVRDSESDNVGEGPKAPAPDAQKTEGKGKPRETKAQRRERIAQRVRELPQEPGCYLMKDRAGEIFYVGKAQNLRSRVRSYFSGSDTRQFVAWLDDLLDDLDVIVVHSEKEALLLERTLVRQHRPRFNVLLQDDKNFIHLRVDTRVAPDDAPKRQKYPRVQVVRNPKDDGAKYFGPYHSASAVRQSLRLINRHFQLRTCTDSVLENRKRPCLQYQIGRCPAPCVDDVPDYHESVVEAAMHLSGQGRVLEKRLEERMWHAAQSESFELAARLRDQLAAVKTSLDGQVVNDVARRKNQDVYGVARSGPLLEVCRVQVRGGRMVSSDSFSFSRQAFPTEELVLSLLAQLYDLEDAPDPQLLPDEILIGLDLEEDAKAFARRLSELKGKRVEVRKPARGQLVRLVDIAEKNAQVALDDRLRKSETREEGLERLQQRLRMTRLPRVIECFDVSLFQGTDAVASQVCFVDGVADKSRYRRYNIKNVDGTDDYLMLYEALTRRLKRGLKDDDLPDLLIVDGGKGQLNVAIAACKDLGVTFGPGAMMLAGIAKARTLDESGKAKVRKRKQSAMDARFAAEGLDEGDTADGRQDNVAEEVDQNDPNAIKRTPERLFVPGIKDPLVLRTHTSERYLVEQLRDEAHRFAITAHRNRRKKRTLASSLDDIPGVGKTKRRALLKELGSVRAIKAASVETLSSVEGIGPSLASTIFSHFHPDDVEDTAANAADASR